MKEFQTVPSQPKRLRKDWLRAHKVRYPTSDQDRQAQALRQLSVSTIDPHYNVCPNITRITLQKSMVSFFFSS